MKLIVAEPGHFHAALLQKEMYPGLDRRVNVYAQVGSDALEYVNRIAGFNARAANPTDWDLDLHFSANPMEELVRDRVAAERGLAAYDIMTERYEVTSELQRELVNDVAVFGELETGDAAQPAISLFSAHHIMKTVAGSPLRRPGWFFDCDVQGEGLSDVGTHLVDLAQWTAFPDRAIDVAADILILEGRRWALSLTAAQLETVTGQAIYPAGLDYYCNNSVDYMLRGVHVRIEAIWNWEAAPGVGDIYTARFRGSKASVDLRQGAAENHRPELYIVPSSAAWREEVFAAARRRIAQLQSRWRGLDAIESGGELRLAVPEEFRVGHEAHFAQVANRFFKYVHTAGAMPHWERPCMMAKYFVSTKGVDAGRKPR
jgi:hypothetical protein